MATKAVKRPPAKKAQAAGVAARVAQLERDRDLLAWLYAELIHGLKMVVAQQILQSPEIQRQMQQQIMAKLT
jgi:hypothetical protein